VWGGGAPPPAWGGGGGGRGDGGEGLWAGEGWQEMDFDGALVFQAHH
jgi:hypothetical protein